MIKRLLSLIKLGLRIFKGYLTQNTAVSFLRGVPIRTIAKKNVNTEISRVLSALHKTTIIARVGETEARAISWYILHRKKEPQKKYPIDIRHDIQFQAGVIHKTEKDLDNFCKLYFSSIKNIDIFAAWLPMDRLFIKKSQKIITLWDLDPFFSEKPWTLSIKESVCVVSPFSNSMKKQIPHLKKIHRNQIFDEGLKFKFVRAPQTNLDFDFSKETLSWFGNLEHLFKECMQQEAKIFIIGCGAYGLPLAQKLCNVNKSSIVLGGVTQLLFGIRGRRWERDKKYRRLMNEYWIRPSKNESPKGFDKLEIDGGAYW